MACRSSASIISSASPTSRPSTCWMSWASATACVGADLDGLLYRRPALSAGAIRLAARFPELDLISKLRYGLHMFLSTKRTRLVGARERHRPRTGSCSGAAKRLRGALAAPVRSQVLRVRRQYLGGVDLDAHQARRHLPPLAVAGGAGLHRRGLARHWSKRWSQAIERTWRDPASRHTGRPIISEAGRVTGVVADGERACHPTP